MVQFETPLTAVLQIMASSLKSKNMVHWIGTSLMSKYISSPQQSHYGAARRVLRYVRGTTDNDI